jgi:glutathione S-transferase
MPPCIVGRSSSHFTRLVRVFARELSVAHDFSPLADLRSRELADYGGNPALKIPILITEQGPWFGALPICRELGRRAAAPLRVVWPEQLTERRAANAQELVLQGMATGVAIIMRGAEGSDGDAAHDKKLRASLENSLSWLDGQLPAVVRDLDPARQLSFLEVSAYCFIEHLAFRQVADVSAHENLQAFCRTYGERASLRATAYRYDAAPPG